MSDDLKPYVINLSEGQLSSSGAYQTTEADITRIFSKHLPDYVKEVKEPRIVVYAHGGLVDEKAGLALARLHTPWWKANGVYPLYFVWETGPLETLWAVNRPKPRPTYDLIEDIREVSEDVRDLVTERLVRGIDGEKYWKQMKDWAAASVRQSGGATIIARKLKEFIPNAGKPVQLHAIGHSAGAIFHSHFLPLCLSSGLSVKSLQLFAPAIRVDEFQGRLMPLLGRGIDDLIIYTMKDAAEKKDVCQLGRATLYYKSLLYLIYRVLEPEANCPLLGLEISLKDKKAVADEVREALKIGVAGQERVRWSPTKGVTESLSHGGFDEDAATMESAAKAILGSGTPLSEPFPAPAVALTTSVAASAEAAAVRGGRPTFDSESIALPDDERVGTSAPGRKEEARIALLKAMQDFMDACDAQS